MIFASRRRRVAIHYHQLALEQLKPAQASGRNCFKRITSHRLAVVITPCFIRLLCVQPVAPVSNSLSAGLNHSCSNPNGSTVVWKPRRVEQISGDLLAAIQDNLWENQLIQIRCGEQSREARNFFNRPPIPETDGRGSLRSCGSPVHPRYSY